MLGVGRSGLRPFPWRETRDPWAVLVSEVMLQQTQAQRVVAPYGRFLDRFPTVTACAEAGLGPVLEAWAGLGYNRRARHLHEAALAIVDRHGGAVPADLADLRALPGVGAYTARAVLVFAFERHEAVVDVNVARVLARAVAGSAADSGRGPDAGGRAGPSRSGVGVEPGAHGDRGRGVQGPGAGVRPMPAGAHLRLAQRPRRRARPGAGAGAPDPVRGF